MTGGNAPSWVDYIHFHGLRDVDLRVCEYVVCGWNVLARHNSLVTLFKTQKRVYAKPLVYASSHPTTVCVCLPSFLSLALLYRCIFSI